MSFKLVLSRSTLPIFFMKTIYIRLPDKIAELNTELLYENKDILIVKSKLINPSKDLILENKTVLRKGFDAIFFEFKREYYGIAKIYNRKKEFTGYYCNINTPVKRFENGYQTTDLFLDLWVYPDGKQYIILDEDEFEDALKENWIDEKLTQKAKRSLEQIINIVKNDKFPPKFVKDYEEL